MAAAMIGVNLKPPSYPANSESATLPVNGIIHLPAHRREAYLGTYHANIDPSDDMLVTDLVPVVIAPR
jgi:hypothetical protein